MFGHWEAIQVLASLTLVHKYCGSAGFAAGQQQASSPSSLVNTRNTTTIWSTPCEIKHVWMPLMGPAGRDFSSPFWWQAS